MNTRSPTNRVEIQRSGIPRNLSGDMYHILLKMKWRYLILIFMVLYLLINALFALFYYMAGDSILNARPGSYLDAFFFSFQTSTSIGYGYLLPKTTLAHIIVIFDAISGVLFVALATGLTFAKFSRPTARVLFSKNILIAKMNGKKTLMFRLGNARKNQILDANINVVVTRPEVSEEGIQMRRIYDIVPIRNHTPLFSLSWTVMHVIHEQSPLFKLTNEELTSSDISFIISLSGTDDVFFQTIYDRKSYSGEEVVFGKQFVNVMGVNDAGRPCIDYSLFHDIEI